jgi:hypothetical protein
MDAWWKTWTELKQLARSRKIILWGRSEDWVPKTIHRLPHKASYIVDINDGYHGQIYSDLEVFSPSKIYEENKDDIYVVITAGPYEGIVAELIEKNFQPGMDFCCCPEYQDFRLLEDMRNYTRDIIVSCSDYSDASKTRYSRAGGGLYRYSIGPNQVTKIIGGCFRQIVAGRDRYFAVEFVERKIYVFDVDFNVIEKWDLDHPNYCGIEYDLKRNTLLVVNAALDTISFHDADSFKMSDRIYFSQKKESNITSHHHLNDICISGDYIYVSYFSRSGNWRKGIYDGGISEFSIERLSDGDTPVVTDLWMPHSPKILDGNLCYLDSMRGRFHTSNQTFAGEFPGFARGLAYDDRFYYIGMSEDMYMSRLFNTKSNIMLNAGFFMFDAATKASRFYPMHDNMNIHDLVVTDIKQ